MSLSVSHTHSRTGSSSDISDAVKTIVGRVNKKFKGARPGISTSNSAYPSSAVNADRGASLGATVFTLEEQAYIVQLMLETGHSTGAVELCQTVLGDFQRTARTYNAQMSNLQQARNAISDADVEGIRMLQERVMVVLTKQRMLDIEIRYLENKIDMLQRRNRAFDEFNDRLVALYSSSWPKSSNKRQQVPEVLERTVDETCNQLHKAEMVLERYRLLKALLMQGEKALEAAAKFVVKFKEKGGIFTGSGGLDNNYLNAMRMCTIQADVVMKQAKFVLPSLFKDQLNVEIFQDGWLSTVFRSDRIEDTTQTLTTFTTQHSAVKPLIEQCTELIKRQAETAQLLRKKYHSSILSRENWQRNILYDSVLGPAPIPAPEDGTVFGATRDKDKEREALYIQMDDLETRLDEIIDDADAHASNAAGFDDEAADDSSVIAASARMMAMKRKHLTLTGSLILPSHTQSSSAPASRPSGSIKAGIGSPHFLAGLLPNDSTARASPPLGRSASPASGSSTLASTPSTVAIANTPPTPILTVPSAADLAKTKPSPAALQPSRATSPNSTQARASTPLPPRRPKRPPTYDFLDIDSFMDDNGSDKSGEEVPPLPTIRPNVAPAPSLSPSPSPVPSQPSSVSPPPSIGERERDKERTRPSEPLSTKPSLTFAPTSAPPTSRPTPPPPSRSTSPLLPPWALSALEAFSPPVRSLTPTSIPGARAASPPVRTPTPIRALPLPSVISAVSPLSQMVANYVAVTPPATSSIVDPPPAPAPRSHLRPSPLPITGSNSTLNSIPSPGMPLTPSSQNTRVPSPMRVPPPSSTTGSGTSSSVRALPVPLQKSSASASASTQSQLQARDKDKDLLQTSQGQQQRTLPVPPPAPPPPYSLSSTPPAPAFAPPTTTNSIASGSQSFFQPRIAVPTPVPASSMLSSSAAQRLETEAEAQAQAQAQGRARARAQVPTQVSDVKSAIQAHVDAIADVVSPTSALSPPSPPPKPSSFAFGPGGGGGGGVPPSSFGSGPGSASSNSSVSTIPQPERSPTGSTIASAYSPDTYGPGAAFNLGSGGGYGGGYGSNVTQVHGSSQSRSQPQTTSRTTIASTANPISATGSTLAPAPYGILKNNAANNATLPYTTTSADAPNTQAGRVRKPSADDWGTAKMAAASASSNSKAKFKAMLNRFRTNSGDVAPGETAGHHVQHGLGKRSAANDLISPTAGVVTTPSMAAAIAAGFVSAPKQGQGKQQSQLQQVQRKPVPRFVDDVEFIPRPDSDSFPYSSDEEDSIAQPPSPSKRNSLTLWPHSSLDNEDEHEEDDEDEEGQLERDNHGWQRRAARDKEMDMNAIEEGEGNGTEEDEFYSGYRTDSPTSQKSPADLGQVHRRAPHHYLQEGSGQLHGVGRRQSRNFAHSQKYQPRGGFENGLDLEDNGSGNGGGGEDDDELEEYEHEQERTQQRHVGLPPSAVASEHYAPDRRYNHEARGRNHYGYDDDDDEGDALRLGLLPGMRVGLTTPVPSYHEREQERETEFDRNSISSRRSAATTDSHASSIEELQAYVEEMMLKSTSSRNNQYNPPHPYANASLNVSHSQNDNHNRNHNNAASSSLPSHQRAQTRALPQHSSKPRPPAALVPGRQNPTTPTNTGRYMF